MPLQEYFEGILVGIAASIPLGPIGVLIIQRTLHRGRFAGLFSGIGAAISDTIYAIIAGFSLSFVIDFITEMQSVLQLIGSLILVGFGFFLFLSNPVGQLRKQNGGASTYMHDLATTFAITITNPMILFIFLGVFTGFNLLDNTGARHVFSLVLGVFTGSALWWFSISTIVNFLRNKFNPRRIYWINRMSGLVIIILAGVSVAYSIAKIAGMNLPNLIH